MAKLKFYYLHCYTSEESAAQPFQPGDELELKIVIDGNAKTYKRNKMWDGRRWDLSHIEADYKNNIEVILTDLDNPRLGDQHDLLGKMTIGTNQVNGAFVFNGHGASYELRWGPA